MTTTIANGSHVSMLLRLLAMDSETENSSQGSAEHMKPTVYDEAPPGDTGRGFVFGSRWVPGTRGGGPGPTDQAVIADYTP